MVQTARVNPYVAKIRNFPGRIFLFEDGPSDVAAVRECMKGVAVRYCEIGSGSGGHLVAAALREPEALFFGFERRYKRAVRTIEKADAAGTANVRVLHEDGARFLEIFGEASLDGIWVNFPDPWSKPRQRKHRVMTETFFAEAAKALRRGGFVSFKSDHQEYFAAVSKLAEASAEFEVTAISSDLYSSEYLTGNIQTEFERLFVDQGLPIGYLRAQKRG